MKEIEELFVGRTNELQEYLTLLEEEPPPWMIAITGIAGIGKSTLLKEMKNRTPLDTTGIISFDFDDFGPKLSQLDVDALADPLTFLEMFADKALTSGCCSKEDIDIFKEKKIDYRTELRDFREKIKAAGARNKSGETEKNSVESISERTLAHFLKENQLYRNAVERNTDFFYDLLNKFEKARLFIMLDTCEQLMLMPYKEFGQWLFNAFLPMLQVRLNYPCYVVAAGRNFPSSRSINDEDQAIQELQLLKEDEVDAYLQDRFDKEKIEQHLLLENAYKMSQGHALCMSIIAELGTRSEFATMSLEDLNGFGQKFDAEVYTELINKRILLKLSSPLRDLVQYGSLPRKFKQPLLEAAFEGEDIGLDTEPEWFEDLISLSFVQSKKGFQYAFHELLRGVLTRNIHNTPDMWARAREYHRKIRDFLTTDPDEGEGTADWHYHNIAFDEEEGMRTWQEAADFAFKEGNYGHFVELLNVVEDETTILEREPSRNMRDEARKLFEQRVPRVEAEDITKEFDNALKEISKKPDATRREREQAVYMRPNTRVLAEYEAANSVEEKPDTFPQPVVIPTTPTPQRLKQYTAPALLSLLVLLLLLVPIIGYVFYVKQQNATASLCNGANEGYVASDTNVLTAANGEHIGLSDGTFAFDTNRPGGYGDLKLQATSKLKACDNSSATSLWNQAATLDTSDAETLIYRENQRVLSSGRPYITLVVGTTLTGDSSTVATGRDNLQGAYVAQKTFNDGFKLPSGVQVRLLIANSGSQSKDATKVATQIVDAAKKDKSIVGVMGWPSSSNVLEAVHILAQAHIPLVSPTASSDKLTGISPYFFRVAPSDDSQAKVGVHYAQQVLHAKKAALFVDPQNVDSQALAQDFRTHFTANSPGNSVIAENYTVGRPDQLPMLLQDAFAQKVDMIYFAGNTTDVSVILINLPTSGPFAHIQVMGGASLYQVGTGTYSPTARPGFNRLHFTAFAYPDEWHFIAPNEQDPGFFKTYKQIFDPTSSHGGNPYGYSRADNDTLLSYDAMLALLQGSSNVSLQKGHRFTGDDVRQGLSAITGANAIQGVSGRLSFGLDGDPLDKTVVMLFVNPDGFIQIEQAQGCFLVNRCSTSP